MTEEKTTLPPAKLGKALAKGFRAAYDSLGYVVSASFGTFLVCAGLLTLASLIARHIKSPVAMLLFVPALLAAWLAEVGMLYFARKSVYEGHAALSDTWEGIGKLIRPAIGLFVADLAITVVLAGDAMFFMEMSHARNRNLFTAVAIFFTYLTIVWLLMWLYHLPLLVAQLHMESGPRVTVILRKGFLLMADNTSFTVWFFVAIIAFTVLCALPGLLGMAVLFPGAVAFLLTCVLRELLIKYGVVEQEPEAVEDKPWRLDS